MTKTTYNIIELLKKNDWISGENIAKNLQISRTAVWKHIQQLKKKGYEITAKPNHGYHLEKTPETITTEELKQHLQPQIIGTKIHHFTSVQSTNDYAKTLAKNGEPEGTLIIADQQTKGRGRKQRLWVSPNNGLWFSMILRPSLPPSKAMNATMCAACALAETINNHTTLQASIKWPNDILIENKKVCGILTELAAEIDEIKYLIVGIGLNVNNTLPKDLQKSSTSLKKETKKPVETLSLLVSLLESFERFYVSLKNGNTELLRKTWRSYSSTIGSQVKVNNEKEMVVGTAVDLGENGELIVKTSKGKKEIITGDISYL